MKKLQLNVDGKSLTLGGPGPQGQKAIDFVRSIPAGKFFTAEGIAECIKSTKSGIHQALTKNRDEIDGYFLLVPGLYGRANRTVYGSKSSIASLKQQLRENGII